MVAVLPWPMELHPNLVYPNKLIVIKYNKWSTGKLFFYPYTNWSIKLKLVLDATLFTFI